MRKWILFALVGLLLAYLFMRREGFQDTAGIKGIYALDGPDPSHPAIGSSAEHVIGLMPTSLIKALQNAKPKTPCPTTAQPLKQCPADPTTGQGMMTLLSGDINDIMVSFYSRIYQPYNAVIKSSDVDTFLGMYPMTPFLTANKDDVKALLVAYFVTQTHGPANGAAPDSSAGAALQQRYNTTDRVAAAAAASYAQNSGYADLAASVQDADNGPLPSPINERASSGDTDMARPLYGDVFATNGPFSGQLGTGQRTGTAAVAGMNGNTYGPPGQTTTFGPFDLWKGTKGTGTRAPTMPGTKMPVDGPGWGGVGSSTMSRSAASSQPAPALYGPVGSGARDGDSGGFGFGGGSLSGWGYSQKNSVDISMLPSNESAGSEPSNAYAVTSRVPGDMDMFPFPYIQSSSYSLANGSMKTDPVPFLTDFSAFQN